MQFCLRDLRSLSQGDFETWHAEDGMPRPRSLSAVVFLDQNVSWLNPVGAWKFVELLPSKCEAEYNGALMVIPGSHKSFLRCPGRQKGANWEKSLQSQAWRTTCSVDSFRHAPSLRSMARPQKNIFDNLQNPMGSSIVQEHLVMHRAKEI